MPFLGNFVRLRYQVVLSQLPTKGSQSVAKHKSIHMMILILIVDVLHIRFESENICSFGLIGYIWSITHIHG